MAAHGTGGVGTDCGSRSKQFQKIFRRVSVRRGRNVGIIATARRLAEVIWYLWFKDVLYREPESSPQGESRLRVACSDGLASPAS